MSKSLAVNVTFHARMHQKGIYSDQNKILETIRVIAENNSELSEVSLRSAIEASLAQDRQQIEILNGYIKSCKDYKLHAAVTFHKLGVIINHGIPKLLQDENAISSILSGKLPLNLNNSVGNDIPTLGTEEYYGSGDPLYVSALLHYTLLNLNLPNNHIINTSESAIYYNNPLPKNFPRLHELSFYNAKDHSLVVAEGGYGFGCPRLQPEIKPFSSYDCASIIEHYTAPQIIMGTADMMVIWNVTTGQFGGWKPVQWESEKLATLYSPITNLEEVQAGDIYFHKILKDSYDKTVYGAGHSAVVTSIANMQITAVGASRDLEREFKDNPEPGMEGIGRQSFAPQVEGKFIGFLRGNEKLEASMPDPFHINKLDWSHESFNEHEVVQYYDSHYGHGGTLLLGSSDPSAAASEYYD